MSIVTTIEVVNQTLIASQVFTVTTVSTGFTVVEGGGGGGGGVTGGGGGAGGDGLIVIVTIY